MLPLEPNEVTVPVIYEVATTLNNLEDFILHSNLSVPNIMEVGKQVR